MAISKGKVAKPTTVVKPKKDTKRLDESAPKSTRKLSQKKQTHTLAGRWRNGGT
jgi:hypothetical protein